MIRRRIAVVLLTVGAAAQPLVSGPHPSPGIVGFAAVVGVVVALRRFAPEVTRPGRGAVVEAVLRSAAVSTTVALALEILLLRP